MGKLRGNSDYATDGTVKDNTGNPSLKQHGPVNLATALTVTSRCARLTRRADCGWAAVEALGTSLPITRWLSKGSGKRRNYRHLSKEVAMATERHGQIVETPTEARQAEPGPSVLALLTASTGLAVLILGIVWFAFFRV
jgi:hypothetical protein